MNSFYFIIEWLLFLLFVLLFLYLPSKLIFNRLKIHLPGVEDIFLSLGTGLVIFTMVSYLLSWLNLELYIFPIFLLLSFISLKSKNWKPERIESKHLKPLIFVIILSLIFSFSIIFLGKYGEGLAYFRDDTWHISLINELKVNFPPDNPGFAGVPLKGYHFFYNFLLAKISSIFYLSPITLHFNLFPLLITFLWGIGVYSLVYRWRNSITASLWAVFLTMFGGSFAFILRLQDRPISLNSGLGISQPTGSLNNPPFAISIVILLCSLFFFYYYFQSKNYKWLIPLSICIGMISMFKVYAGIILFFGFAFLIIVDIFRKRFKTIIFAILSLIIFFITYWVFAGGQGSLIFYPFWPIPRLLQSFPWYGFDEKIYTFTRLNVLRGLFETYLYGTILFVFGNLGTRLLGLLLILILFFQKKKVTLFSWLMIVITLISFLIPLLFIQTGKVFEIIQLDWYFLFFVAIFASAGFSAFFSFRFNKLIKIVLIIIIVVFTLPSAFEDYTSILNNLKNQKESSYDKAYLFLSKKGSYHSTVLEVPSSTYLATESALNKWYDSNSTPALIAFSNKRGYLNNEFISFPGVNLSDRLVFLKEIMEFSYSSTASAIKKSNTLYEKLKKENINYIFSPYEIKNFNNIKSIKIIYSKDNYTVYEVR